MDDDGVPARARRMPMHREVAYWLFAALVGLGVAFWLWWGFAFQVWLDNGVYAVVVTLVAFGLAGMWLVSPDPPVTAPVGAPKT